MRILLACPYAWDLAGGVQTHVRELAGALAARGHTVAIVAPTRGGPTRPSHGSDQRPRPTAHLVGRAVALRWAGSVATLCPSPRSLRRIRHVMATFRPDVVHVHEPLVPSTSMLAALAATAPVVATFHASCARARLMVSAAPLLRIVCRRIVAAIAVSATAAEHAGRVFRGSLAIVPNGISADHFRPPSRRTDGVPPGHVILWAHRLEPRKGFTTALRAFAVLAAEIDDVRLVVIGDGPERGALTLVPPRHRSRITMLGQVHDDELPLSHAAADAFIAPSLGPESFGISMVEAMAAGVPVVASDLRAHREVALDGVAALLVPPGDPTALAAALRRVVTDPRLAADLARAGRARAQRYAWDAVVPELTAIYRQMVSEPPPHAISAA